MTINGNYWTVFSNMLCILTNCLIRNNLFFFKLNYGILILYSECVWKYFIIYAAWCRIFHSYLLMNMEEGVRLKGRNSTRYKIKFTINYNRF